MDEMGDITMHTTAFNFITDLKAGTSKLFKTVVPVPINNVNDQLAWFSTTREFPVKSITWQIIKLLVWIKIPDYLKKFIHALVIVLENISVTDDNKMIPSGREFKYGHIGR